MKIIKIRCATCQLPLTQPLQLLTNDTLLSEEDGKDYLPRGFYIIADPDSYFTETDGKYLVNLKDLVNTKLHPDKSRRNGCCGMNGLDGLNVVCRNGHEIGTECSDCWLAHSLCFEPTAVTAEHDINR